MVLEVGGHVVRVAHIVDQIAFQAVLGAESALAGIEQHLAGIESRSESFRSRAGFGWLQGPFG